MADIPDQPAERSILSIYLDDEKPDNIMLFLVHEVVSEKYGYMQAGAVQASAHGGWRHDPGTWLKRRQEYDDVGEHSLLSETEALPYLEGLGLQLEDGKNMLIARLTALNGRAPDIQPEDPNLKTRRDTARARLGLPARP